MRNLENFETNINNKTCQDCAQILIVLKVYIRKVKHVKLNNLFSYQEDGKVRVKQTEISRRKDTIKKRSEITELENVKTIKINEEKMSFFENIKIFYTCMERLKMKNR